MVLGAKWPFLGTAAGEGIREEVSKIGHDEPQTVVREACGQSLRPRLRTAFLFLRQVPEGFH